MRPQRLWGAVAGALAIGTVAIFALGFWPGHMSNDSLAMIGQARGSADLTDQHSPMLVWLWGIFWPIGLRPGAILVLGVCAFLAGAYLVARAGFGRRGAILVAVGVALSPPVFGNLGVISRDVWFLDFLLLSFGMLVLAVRAPQHRRFGLWGAGVFAVLCLFARQNAAAAIVVLAVAMAAVLLSGRLRERGRVLRAALIGAAGTGAVIAALALQLGATKAVGAEPVNPDQYVYFYDLAGLSIRDGVSHFPEEVYPSGDVATLAATSSIDSIIALGFGDAPPIPMPRTDEEVASMREAWLDQVTGEPLEYLEWRWDAFEAQIGFTSPGVFIYHPGVDPNPYGYEVEFTRANQVVTDYQELFADDQLNGHTYQRGWFYLLLALLASVVLFQGSVTARVVGALALATWTYQVGLFFGTMGTQWRFEFPVAAVALICFAVAVKTVVDLLRERRAPEPEPEPEPGAAT